ncbi:RING-H2 finger protein ATL34-like [Telopea speciosissima]|uniref:RING-H2 finger protein ATL34-like n=1 Tax=Telopea speciosissima TaxID=54955 RepID=UPI001CC416E9|nr:RING-H2 finger protein ATL34-like [Telopea speciosissima]
MSKELMQKHSNCSILCLFGRSSAAQNVLICIYLFLMFLSLPYAVAQSSSEPPPIEPYQITYTYSPSVINNNIRNSVIALAFIFSAFFLFFITVCICQCCRTENDRSIHPNGVIEILPEGQRERKAQLGLDSVVIESLPTFAYSHVKGHKLGNGALECAVCLNEFEDEDTIRLLPKCNHVFHADCIDAWFSNHTTCPVCRANLVPVPGETPATIVPVHDIEGDSDWEIPTSEPGVEAENEQVSINGLSEGPQVVAVAPEVINQTPMQNRPARSTKPRYVGRFKRSHSTGHSLVQPGEDVKRFTLRLPDDVRKQIMNMRQVNRTRSLVAIPVLVSPRKGYPTTGEGSSRGGKSMGEKPEGWVFSMTLPFFMKATSPRSSKMIAEGDTPVTSPRPKPLWLPLRVWTKAADDTVASLTPSPV